MVVEATGPRDGTLTTSEGLAITFNAVDPDGVGGATLQIDGNNFTPGGPYTAATGSNFGALIGTLSADPHKYSIVATDKPGNQTSPAYTGTFNVVAALTVDATAPPQGSLALLTDEQLAPIVLAAERRLAATNGNQILTAMADVNIQVADLPSELLGETEGKTILIDRDASGYGWFVDPTPYEDAEFTKAIGSGSLQAADPSPAAHRVDLLTAVMHEMEHELGLSHTLAPDLMNAILPLGVRRLP